MSDGKSKSNLCQTPMVKEPFARPQQSFGQQTLCRRIPHSCPQLRQVCTYIHVVYTSRCVCVCVCECHPCAGAKLIFSASFQYKWVIPEGNPGMYLHTYVCLMGLTQSGYFSRGATPHKNKFNSPGDLTRRVSARRMRAQRKWPWII